MAVYDWVFSSKTAALPANAVEGGNDVDGSKIYVGKASFKGDEIPCKIIPSRKQAYVCHNGDEHEVSSYQVMVKKKLKWVNARGSSIPANAVVGGRTANGETLYIGRVKHGGGALSIGKVHPSHGSLYVPFGGKELAFKEYEIMIQQ